tara:strand:- start:394 stop:603 length:210 start_codon:yes stop_codon:yes gene_type:complete
MAYKQKRSMIAGTDPVKKAKEKKADTHASSEPSVEEQLKLRNNNQSLKDQCAKNGGTWDTTTGTCKYKK